MSIFGLVSNLVLWVVTAVLGFLLLGALRALALLRWRVEQLEATTPSRLGPQRTPDRHESAGFYVAHHFRRRSVAVPLRQSQAAPGFHATGLRAVPRHRAGPQRRRRGPGAGDP